MPKLPVVSGEELIKALSKIGFRTRKGKGSHVILQRPNDYRNVSVPLHKRLKPGTLRGITSNQVSQLRNLSSCFRIKKQVGKEACL